MTAVKSSVWVTIAPVLVINAVLFVTLMVFAFSKDRPEKPEYLRGRHESKFLGSFFREWWYWVTDPIARFLIKIRLNPNSITLVGTLIGCLSAIFFAGGLFGWAGWIMVFGATFDMFDGRVARLLKKESRSGAYLDSVMDRVSEGAVFAGLAYFFRGSWMLLVVIIGLIGSMLVSYTRARGEGVGVVCKKGSMQRPERIVYIGVSAILQPAADSILSIWWKNPAPVLCIGALCIVAVMTIITSAQRIIYIMNDLDTQDRDDEELSVPQLLSQVSTKEGRGRLIEMARYGYDRSHAIKKHCMIILVDGANWSVFNELVSRGDLPNISRYVLEGGTFMKAVTTFPSTTGPAFTPFLTGCFAGTCDIPGIRWFDRRIPHGRKLTLKRFRDYYGWGSYAMDSDLSKDVRTIFEYSRKAINIMGMVSRGAGVTRDPGFFKIPILFYKAKRKDNIEAVERTAFRMFMSAINRSPDFIFYYFPSVDKYSHEYHNSHEKVIAAYRRLDSYVEKIVDELKEQGIWDETAIIIAGDHGHSDVSRHFDLDAFFEKRFKMIHTPSKLKEWASADVINMISGNSMSNVYLRKNNWRDSNYFEDIEKMGIIDELLSEEAVDIVMGRSAGGGIQVASRRGRAKILEKNFPPLTEGCKLKDNSAGSRIIYDIAGADPFGYQNNIPSEMSLNAALIETYETDYPDAILQSVQLFRSDRAGDLVISTSPGYDLCNRFETPTNSSTHGSLHAEHMFVPLCINCKIGKAFARTADIFPTVVNLLGIVPEHKMDGVSLV